MTYDLTKLFRGRTGMFTNFQMTEGETGDVISLDL